MFPLGIERAPIYTFKVGRGLWPRCVDGSRMPTASLGQLEREILGGAELQVLSSFFLHHFPQLDLLPWQQGSEWERSIYPIHMLSVLVQWCSDVVLKVVASASPENVAKMQILRPQPRLSKSETTQPSVFPQALLWGSDHNCLSENHYPEACNGNSECVTLTIVENLFLIFEKKLIIGFI